MEPSFLRGLDKVCQRELKKYEKFILKNLIYEHEWNENVSQWTFVTNLELVDRHIL